VLAVVTHHDTDHAPTVGEAPALDLHDLAANGLDGPLGQRGDGPVVAEVLVGAREVEKQFPDGAYSEAVKLFETVLADAAQGVDALEEWVGLGGTGRVGRHGKLSRPGKT
jgi:hypothetical protein